MYRAHWSLKQTARHACPTDHRWHAVHHHRHHHVTFLTVQSHTVGCFVLDQSMGAFGSRARLSSFPT